MSDYILGNEWDKERERLAGLEAIWDPGTFRVLESLGLEDGWQCLEVGAGGGSVAEWLCRRVGPTGSVVATDIDVRFLEPLSYPNLEVLRHDVRYEELPDDSFDLVHARTLVEHLGEDKEIAIKRMVTALKPEGFLLLEDFDFSSGSHPVIGDEEIFDEVRDAFFAFVIPFGYDKDYGRKLPADLIRLGIRDVKAEGRSRLIYGGTPESAFFSLGLERFRAPLVSGGFLTEEKIDEALGHYARPDMCGMTPVLVAAWGRRP